MILLYIYTHVRHFAGRLVNLPNHQILIAAKFSGYRVFLE